MRTLAYSLVMVVVVNLLGATPLSAVSAVAAPSATPTEMVCVNDLNNNGYAGEPGETATCSSSKTLDSFFCPIGAVQCDKKENIIIEPSVDSCPTGYRKDASGETCTRENYLTQTPSLNCPSGYRFNTVTKLCEVGSVTTTQPAKVCPSGQTLENGGCYLKTTGTECASNPAFPKECTFNRKNDSAIKFRYGGRVGETRYEWSGRTIGEANSELPLIGSDGYVYSAGKHEFDVRQSLTYVLSYHQICRCSNTTLVGNPTNVCTTGTYNSSSGLCENNTIVTSQPTRSCPADYSYNPSKNLCERTVVATVPIAHNCPDSYYYKPSTKQCEKSELYDSCPLAGGGVCVTSAANNRAYCSPNPCFDRGTEFNRDEIDGTMLVDNGSRNEEGMCTDQVMIFTGRASECLPSGTSTAFQNCCKNSGEVSHDSTGSATEIKAGVSALKSIYQVTSAAASAYTTSLSQGASQAQAANAATSAANSQISALMNPATIAWAVVIYFVMDYLMQACDAMSMETSMHNDSGFCHEVGTYCKTEWLGSCVQKAKSYCCFNSKMARIVHEQGRPQLKSFDGWGEPEEPNCEGFSPEEFQALDFSRIDMSEYYDDLVHKTQQSITKSVNESIGNYFEATQ